MGFPTGKISPLILQIIKEAISLKLVSYLCSSDIKMASFVRRILHSMLLMIYEWPNQLKLWYMH